MKLRQELCCVCKKKSQSPLCSKCQSSPFRIEEYRNVLAEKKDFNELKKWYKKSLPEIPNLNTSKFWNKKLEEQELLSDQDGMTQNRIKKVAEFLNPNSKKILDAGAGHGYLEEYLSKKRRLKIYANDFSKESVEHLKERFKGEFTVQSIYNLKYKESYFDAIFTLEVLEHIPPHRILPVLKSIKNLLKPNGEFILSVPTNEGLEKMKINHNGHTRLYTIPIITSELEMSGFTIKEVKTLYAFDKFYNIKNIFALFYKKWQPNNIIIKAQVK